VVTYNNGALFKKGKKWYTLEFDDPIFDDFGVPCRDAIGGFSLSNQVMF